MLHSWSPQTTLPDEYKTTMSPIWPYLFFIKYYLMAFDGQKPKLARLQLLNNNISLSLITLSVYSDEQRGDKVPIKKRDCTLANMSRLLPCLVGEEAAKIMFLRYKYTCLYIKAFILTLVCILQGVFCSAKCLAGCREYHSLSWAQPLWIKWPSMKLINRWLGNVK